VQQPVFTQTQPNLVQQSFQQPTLGSVQQFQQPTLGSVQQPTLGSIQTQPVLIQQQQLPPLSQPSLGTFQQRTITPAPQLGQGPTLTESFSTLSIRDVPQPGGYPQAQISTTTVTLPQQGLPITPNVPQISLGTQAPRLRRNLNVLRPRTEAPQ
jgi:hypothetical protein